MRHKIVNIQVLIKIYEILGITQISSGSFSYRINIDITLNYILGYLSSIDCCQFNTFTCFITHEIAKVSLSCFYRSSPIINKFLLLKMTFFFQMIVLFRLSRGTFFLFELLLLLQTILSIRFYKTIFFFHESYFFCLDQRQGSYVHFSVDFKSFIESE